MLKIPMVAYRTQRGEALLSLSRPVNDVLVTGSTEVPLPSQATGDGHVDQTRVVMCVRAGLDYTYLVP